MSLAVQEHINPGPRSHLVILLHGRGSDERDLLPLAAWFGEGARVLSVRAPHRYGPGYAWYHDLETGADELDASVQGVNTLIDQHREDLPVVLLGFSQGGLMAAATAVERRGRNISAVLSLSAPPLQRWPDDRPLSGVPVFWGHGTEDAVVSLRRGEKTLEILQRLGAIVSAHRYPISHTIGEVETEDIKNFLAVKK